jgi:hypothetical protein
MFRRNLLPTTSQKKIAPLAHPQYPLLLSRYSRYLQFRLSAARISVYAVVSQNVTYSRHVYLAVRALLSFPNLFVPFFIPYLQLLKYNVHKILWQVLIISNFYQKISLYKVHKREKV